MVTIPAFLAALEAERDTLIALRRDFHRHPELGLHEFRTAARIEEELDRCGISHTRVGDTGVLGILRGEGDGSGVIALRADIDALPIQETADVPYRSETDGVMHACGHDAHTACLLSAARLLARYRNAFGGEIRFLFQPAEEIGQGAREFVASGALTGADRVFGLHTAYDLPVGTVGLKPGLNNASVDHFALTFHGKSAHVSTPQLGADALYIASQFVVSLQSLVTRMSSPIEPLLVGVGKLTAGTAYNAVAEQAVLEGTTRAVSQESRYRIRALIDSTAQHTAAIYGGTAETVWTDFTAPVINDAAVCREAAEVVETLWGSGHVTQERRLSLGGDNFADLQLCVPGAYAYLGTGNAAKPATLCSNHNGGFSIDEDALPLGAGLYAAYALSQLGGLERAAK